MTSLHAQHTFFDSCVVRNLHELNEKIDLLENKIKSKYIDISEIVEIDTKLDNRKYSLYKNAARISSFISTVLESTIFLSIFALLFDSLTTRFARKAAIIQKEYALEDRITMQSQISNTIVADGFSNSVFINAMQLEFCFDPKQGFIQETRNLSQLAKEEISAIHEKQYKSFEQYLSQFSPSDRMKKLNEFNAQIATGYLTKASQERADFNNFKYLVTKY